MPTGTNPISILESWPLFEPSRQLELGCVVRPGGVGLADAAVRQVLGHKRAGWWSCDLPRNELTWTAGVYHIFGFHPGARVRRGEAVRVYCEESRALMERLRSDSIALRHGFALDAQIRPADGTSNKWMRLLGEPVIEGGEVVRLQGLKLIL